MVLTVICPARVFMHLLSFKGLTCIPFGNTELLMRVLTDPEPRRTLWNLLLLTEPIVLATAMVAGVCCCSLTLGSSCSVFSVGVSALNLSRLPLNSGVAVRSLSEFTVVEAKENVSKGCATDYVTLELEITS